MKKTYQSPEIEVLMMESTELLQESLGVWSDEQVTSDKMLTREIIFDDED